MKLRPEQLPGALAKGLTGVYAICGDEALLTDEAAALVRDAARKAGVAERQSFQVETGFNWGAWLAGFDSLSLFSARQLIELHLPTGKAGIEGGKTLEAWCKQPPPDTILMVLLPRADRAMQQTKWYGALDKSGITVHITPPTPEQLPAWIGARLGRYGLKADRETLAFLASRVEGNLLAAHQEIEKLALLLPPGELSLEDARNAVTDVARYDASDLPDAFLKADATRYCRIIDGLEAEGETPILALWLLSQELRTLYRLAAGVQAGEALSGLMRENRVWDSRQALAARAVKQYKVADLGLALRVASRIDRANKGLLQESGWAMLKQLGLGLMAKTPLKDEYRYGY
ncbi:MAG: DNA polymerase III subunit delta [Hydrogenophilales bacterium CG03_land_8_20_14_0_80_62_28]|nr:DNA polymerase III subunit delta [Betaproteobacteria bacterium]OIO78549.1 MAG: DNA polymerase III subunit delta [Hydrogenophilaceae bacterium CG1_02_62_390]PIV22214.1 MAG: DNA polymerase III subunit delta [Hydrogenophilales bacterium CG03_land_8_20_14_0_80_62_28]PIW37606.1 MAG: DNA polymerase III subunit delta [Hydrogenophilales bacterium CG15_BIG_FIL_POST_REV_8_21_14_020_62_31]PIW71814.1 MAG: DNA polymerase III subunit delta [Hydrogenophilales bacterium CG12_big_fil_rev_8_21_14_0_65_61_21]